jgi:hypothetical protein
MAAQQTNDFIILGPSIGSGAKVLDSIHALYFLPENFKLVLASSAKADQSFLNEIAMLIERDELGDRVILDGDIDATHAVVLPNTGMSRIRNSITGNSPEALASAILYLFRTRV